MKVGQQFLLACALLLVVMLGSRANSVSMIGRMSYVMLTDSIAPKSTSAKKLTPPKIPEDSGDKERIFIEHVDILRYDKQVNPDAQLLLGNVQLRHKDALMYCDSALLYEAENRFEAYGNVRIEQGDSLFIYCNYLDYDGQIMLARLRELVRMEHGENTLYTDSLDYDRVLGIGYYFDYGSIVDSLNILSSVYGEYSTITKKAVFNDSVILENPNFTLYSDTLNYDTETKIATILGPTRIVGDSGVIHATRGQYNTQLDRAYLMDKPIIESGTRWMTGDSIYYDRPGKLAEMYGNIVLKDTLDKVELKGGYAEYHEDTESGLARERAYITDYSSTDTLYAHATVMEMDKVDSVATLFRGLGNVRVYRKDMQAVSDSLAYHTGDSVMTCTGNPFIWSGNSQVTGDSISVYMKGDAVDYAHVRENAFMSSQVDDKHYNQMRGREVFAYFSNSQLDSLRTKGNSEIKYFSVSKDSIPLEMIQTQSSDILMLFENEEIVKIKMTPKSGGTITPVLLLEPDQFSFPNFVWFPEARPRKFEDIFLTTPKPGNKKSEGEGSAQEQSDSEAIVEEKEGEVDLRADEVDVNAPKKEEEVPVEESEEKK